MKKISSNSYSIEIPENWEMENNENSDSVFDPNGKGSITISSYTNTKGQADPEKALSNFVKGKGVIESKNHNTTESTYTDENGRYIYASAITKGNILVLASYNCEKESISQTEVDTVKKVIASIAIN